MSNLKRDMAMFCFNEILHEVATVCLCCSLSFNFLIIGKVDVHLDLYDCVTM